MEPVEFWILDRVYEGPFCPNCEVDISTDVLDKAFKMNKQRKWSHRVVIKCRFCKKAVAFDVEWIPETAKAVAIQV